MTIELGDTAKDTITGFSGVVTSRHEYLNGCIRLTVQSPVLKEGKVLEPETFDLQQLELVAKAQQTSKAANTGGPDRAMPAARIAPAR